MKFLQLLQHRGALLRHARLANLAFAYDRLTAFAARLDRAQIRGEVTIRPADPSADHLWPSLTVRGGHQSVVEEHFTDEDLAELADVLAFLHERPPSDGFTFPVADLENRFLAPLRDELTRAGVELAPASPAPQASPRPRG